MVQIYTYDEYFSNKIRALEEANETIKKKCAYWMKKANSACPAFTPDQIQLIRHCISLKMSLVKDAIEKNKKDIMDNCNDPSGTSFKWAVEDYNHNTSLLDEVSKLVNAIDTLCREDVDECIR